LRAAVLAAAIAVPLGAAPDASAHTLSLKRAKKAVTAVARELAVQDRLSRGSARNCSRVNAHKVRCDAVTRGFDSSEGAAATCTRRAVASLRRHRRGKRPSRRVVVKVRSRFRCTYDHGNGGGGPNVDPPPAPDTMITGGPAEGSTVQIPPYSAPPQVFVQWQFQAVGGEDPIFECSDDGEPFERCSPGGTRAYGPGFHTFRVRAVSIRLGAPTVPDPTPAQRSFTVAQ
jgi:hypothetical protein